MRGFLKFLDVITFSKIKSSVLVLPTMEKIDQRVMNEERRPWSYPAHPERVSNESFIDLVNRAAQEAVIAITKANQYILGNLKRDTALKEYSGINLDTGLRDKGVLKMTTFSPLK